LRARHSSSESVLMLRLDETEVARCVISSVSVETHGLAGADRFDRGVMVAGRMPLVGRARRCCCDSSSSAVRWGGKKVAYLESADG
jgi:hypothetical protein